MLCDDDNESNAGFYGLQSGLLNRGWWHKKHGGLCTLPGDSLSRSIVYWNTLHHLSPFARGDSGNDIGPVIQHPFSLDPTYLAGNALYQNPGLTVKQDAHVPPSSRRASCSIPFSVDTSVTTLTPCFSKISQVSSWRFPRALATTGMVTPCSCI